MDQQGDALRCVPLKGPGAWRAYHRFCRRIYASDPVWVPPLRHAIEARWSRNNPWFSHAKGCAWLAYRGSQMVGCISAQLDSRAGTGSGLGYFGQFECIDDPEVALFLFQQAEHWLRANGAKIIRGPFDLHINDATGLLVDGFEYPPMMMMPHHPRYYEILLHTVGYEPVMRLYAYSIRPDFEAPQAMRRLLARYAHRLSIAPINTKQYASEIDLICGLFNDAWQSNWGFVPFSQQEFRALGQELKPILRSEYTAIARMDGEPVGFLIALPNLNELIQDFQGRLWPLNIFKLIKRLKMRNYRTARVPLMGVKSDFHQSPLGAMIAFSMIDQVRWPLHENGIEQVEMSWILETNQGMNALIESMGGSRYKTYKVYERVV